MKDPDSTTRSSDNQGKGKIQFFGPAGDISSNRESSADHNSSNEARIRLTAIFAFSDMYHPFFVFGFLTFATQKKAPSKRCWASCKKAFP
jgi:hypothetical protein